MALQRCNVIFCPDFRVEFWKGKLGGAFLEGEFFGGPLVLEKKHRIKKFDPRIRLQNSGVQNLFPRIRS